MLELPPGAKNRRKATVIVRRYPLRYCNFSQLINKVHSINEDVPFNPVFLNTLESLKFTIDIPYYKQVLGRSVEIGTKFEHFSSQFV